MRLRIASRQSDLARIQAHEVANALKAVVPNLEVELHFSESLGDKNLIDPLWKMPGKGVFTEDLTNDLAEGRADMVVHSWKDLPVEDKPDTEIVASLPRADCRDLLLFKKSSRARLSDGASVKIFSSSPRREYNLRPFLKDHLPGQISNVEFTSVRGNIPTRCRKLLEADEIDGLIVAKAAIDRLLAAQAEEFKEGRNQVARTLAACDWMALPLTANPAAAAQGALAIEIRRDRQDLREVLALIHNETAFMEANLERQILKAHGGGCHQKIGATVLSRPQGHLRFLRGLTEAGVELRERSWQGESAEPVHVLRSDWLFDRRKISLNFTEAMDGLFVSHAAAFPEELHGHTGLVWVAGLSTWKNLARLGVWVNGSSEGLGEQEPKRLELLSPGTRWTNLTHDRAPAQHSLATYSLLPKTSAEPPPASGILHWTSAVLFEEALQRWPDLRDRQHSCGPGKTFERLQAQVDQLSIRWGAEDSRRKSE